MPAYSYVRFSSGPAVRSGRNRRLDASAAWAVERQIELTDDFAFFAAGDLRGWLQDEVALRSFESLVRKGDVEPGAGLFLDGLHARTAMEAVRLLPRLRVLAGIGVAILVPAGGGEFGAEYLGTVEGMASLAAVLGWLAADHISGDTQGSVWRHRRPSPDAVLRAPTPPWLDKEVKPDGTVSYTANKIRAKTVRLIFRLAKKGLGRRAIADHLKAINVPRFPGCRSWGPSYIDRLIENRAVLGEYQAYGVDENGDMVPVGPPVPDYYPRIISGEAVQRGQPQEGEPGNRGAAGLGRRRHPGGIGALPLWQADAVGADRRRVDSRSAHHV